MRVWFMVGALVLGIIGFWGEQGRTGRTARPADGGGIVTAQDGGSTVPSPKAP